MQEKRAKFARFSYLYLKETIRTPEPATGGV